MKTHTQISGRTRLAFLSLALVILIPILPSPSDAKENESDAMITCTVRIEHGDQLAESFADGLTIEEAEDVALEGACALRCVSKNDDDAENDAEAEAVEKSNVEGGDLVPSPEKTQDADLKVVEALATDDPDGVEACIERCAEDAILIGTLCTDSASETVFAEGAFDPDDEPGTKAAGVGYGGEGKEGSTAQEKPASQKAAHATPPKQSQAKH